MIFHKSGYVDVETTDNYVGEYQGSVTTNEILSKLELFDVNLIIVICRGGNKTNDGAVMPKFAYDGSTFGLSAPFAGTYRMYFTVLYRLP